MTFPDMSTPGSTIALLSPWTVAGQDDEIVDRLAAERPPGLVSLARFAGVDGTTATLAHARWQTEDSCRDWFHDHPDIHGQPRYFRVAGSYDGEPGKPTMLATPRFACDSADAQRTLADTIVTTLTDLAPPGLVAAHMHYSLDGALLVNCAQWTNAEAWRAFVDGHAHERMRDAFSALSAVRPLNTPLGVERYRLGGS